MSIEEEPKKKKGLEVPVGSYPADYLPRPKDLDPDTVLDLEFDEHARVVFMIADRVDDLVNGHLYEHYIYPGGIDIKRFSPPKGMDWGYFRRIFPMALKYLKENPLILEYVGYLVRNSVSMNGYMKVGGLYTFEYFSGHFDELVEGWKMVGIEELEPRLAKSTDVGEKHTSKEVEEMARERI